MCETELLQRATQVINKIKSEGHTLALAESCTGGWLSKIITDVSGASAVYKGGICSYSNEVKMSLLGVKEETLAQHGAVSEQTARQMAVGVKSTLKTDIGVGITGIAGPSSDNTNKPVGLIYVAVAFGDSVTVTELRNTFTESVRTNNRASAVDTALNLLGDIYER
ncbi:MAG: CinA family protein [Clostridia bacterium]|nr:CinA family protein [Clostridia bacterium]